jgi:hypothetical protein
MSASPRKLDDGKAVDIKAALAQAGDKETLLLGGVEVEMRSCRLSERLEFVRMSAAAAAETDPLTRAALTLKATGYLVAICAFSSTGERVFDPGKPDEVADTLAASTVEALGEVAVRVCGLDKLAEQAAKNASRANTDSSSVSPATSDAPSKSLEEDSPPGNTPTG